MPTEPLPPKLLSLHLGEEHHRSVAIDLIGKDPRLRLHLDIVEHAMDLADRLRQFPTDDEDVKVTQALSIRLFNAFGAAVKLALSGYNQNAAMVLRDILETVFLLDFFQGDRPSIEKWRMADRKTRLREYSPLRIREALDTRYGHTEKKRAAMYKMFSELAGHPTMIGTHMLRPRKDGDIVIGPFIEGTSLDAVLSEAGRLAIQVGEILDGFFPRDWRPGDEPRHAFASEKRRWLATFYPSPKPPTPGS